MKKKLGIMLIAMLGLCSVSCSTTPIIDENDYPTRYAAAIYTEETSEDSVITNITAPPIPAAVFVFLETPKNGQIPRNWLRTRLFISAVVISTRNNFPTIIYPPFLHLNSLHSHLSILFLLPFSFPL